MKEPPLSLVLLFQVLLYGGLIALLVEPLTAIGMLLAALVLILALRLPRNRS